jgi:PAS fold
VGAEGAALRGLSLVQLVPAGRRRAILDIMQAVGTAAPNNRTTFDLVGLGAAQDRVLEAAISPLDSHEGRLLVMTIRDVTEQRKARAHCARRLQRPSTRRKRRPISSRR